MSVIVDDLPADEQWQHLRVPETLAGRRLDQVAAMLFDEYSRSRLQRWIDDGRLLCDGREGRRKKTLSGGERLSLWPEVDLDERCLAQPIPLSVVFEDAEILVIDKPAGLVVHPAAGNRDGTMQNGLLHHDPALAGVPRAGIVHRLDKDTSGLLVVARTLGAHRSLVDQLARRSVKREYRALVRGCMVGGGRVDAPIGRHPTQRTRMAVVAGGREAVTHYQVSRRFTAHTLLAVRLQTGRTHQIRVHMAHLKHPLVGDPVYSGRARLPAGASERLRAELSGFSRQALHAARLGLIHPASGEMLEWESPLPADFAGLLEVLEQEEVDDAMD